MRDQPDPHHREPHPGPRKAPMDHIREAREQLRKNPLAPSVGTLRTLRREDSTPIATHGIVVREFSITGGRPRHGALRSDDHIGSYEAVVPFTMARDDHIPDECDQCGHDRLIYETSTHHHIAGYEAAECAHCGAEVFSEEWN